MGGCIRKGRRSVFTEVGLDDHDAVCYPPSLTLDKQRHVSFKTPDKETDIFAFTSGDVEPQSRDQSDREQDEDHDEGRRTNTHQSPESHHQQHQHERSHTLPPKPKPWYTKLANRKGRPMIRTAPAAPPAAMSSFQRFTMLAMLIAVVLPAFSWRSGDTTVELNGAGAGAVTRREDSPTNVCTRWALQSAVLNGTVYMYGGRAKMDGDQENNTWNNYFLTLDLDKNWNTDSPPLKGLERPDGPPELSMGYLWNDYNNLYLYGGQFSDSPFVDPGPESVWKYSIKDSKWTEFANPKTSAGNYSEAANFAVHRAAEGAGLSVPELGLSWYFGGHLDWSTTPGWSKDIDRVYLKSLLEFTHPGYVNSGVTKLSTGTGAGQEGAFRNITKGGVQQAGKFPERADGVLVFIPGWGDMGVLIGLAGGTADNFTDDLQTLDVYDIAHSEWFHQETSGNAPGVRVNPCAVVASAPDASSFQIYVFGGQNLPYGNQTQYDDMYILSIPSFTWIKVDQSDQDVPSPRAGHSCAMRDGQLVVIGGYVGDKIPCDEPGIYVFDASTLKWKTKFHAGDHDADWHPDNLVLAGSYGYKVPKAVQQVVGGDSDGGATQSTPAAGPATDGPFATGKPPVYTITQSGPTATITHSSDPTGASDDDPSSGPQPGLVAAGIVAGIAGLLALYLGFCAWLYRRQVRAYRQHLAVTNRYSGASMSDTNSLNPSMAQQQNRWSSRESFFGWIGSTDRDVGTSSIIEPKFRPGEFDDPSPGMSSGTTAATATAGAVTAVSSASKQSGESRLGGSANGSTERLLEGQEPSFFNVVMGPRRALRVVNGVE